MTATTTERLGFPADARAAIVHADDLGLCHAANVAFWEDQAFGVVTSGAVMMPCSWAPEMAAWCRENPGADVGVHITLNCEWSVYRWGALSTRDRSSGLIDEQGYMWRSVEELHRHMDPAAAVAEMRAQIETALALGIDVTHIDTHMGAVMHPQLLPAYVELAVEYRVPAMLPRIPRERMAPIIAEICFNTSMQSRSLSTIFLIPRSWPSIRLIRLTYFFLSSPQSVI